MTADSISEARAADKAAAAVDALEHRMSADLCVEISAMAIAAERRPTDVQKGMSDNLRKEFEATRAFVTESLTRLARGMHGYGDHEEVRTPRTMSSRRPSQPIAST